MARFYGPTTVFFDEIDALFCRSDDGSNDASRRVKAELLVQMDGVTEASSAGANAQQNDDEKKKRVIVIAATNRPWDLDEALIRRLEKRIYIALPSEKGRRQLFEISLKQVKVDEKIDWEMLLKNTEGYSGADITNVCREASLMPFRKMLKENPNIEELASKQTEIDIPITMQDFRNALKNISKSVSTEYLDRYAKWMKEYGSV
eukprot:TRINITY_DN3408_c0_g1_i2.p1 TRINITY_DN3408_c0_g1~~TRINITY_DN3408_c0_g1_i2.p1  ORF type:complete len:204 (-),score=86.99 TRINITY_DN3408_c0_g1_i2:57-668(-)